MLIVYDIIMLAGIAIFMVIGCKRGFLSTLVSMLKWVAAFVAAGIFAGMLAECIFDKIIAPNVEKQIAECVTLDDGTLSTYEKIGDITKTLEEKYNIHIMENQYADIFSLLNKMTEDGETPEHIICYTLVRPIQLNMIKPICYICIFSLVLLISVLMQKMCGVINVVPIVGSINKILGAGLGIIYGAIVLSLVCGILAAVANLTHNSISWLNNDLISKTILMKYIMSFSLFKLL